MVDAGAWVGAMDGGMVDAGAWVGAMDGGVEMLIGV